MIQPTTICQHCKTSNRGEALFCSGCGKPLPRPARIFISYSHEDERWKNKLLTHLSILQRVRGALIWHDRDIKAGDDWATGIDTNLEEATIILLLISPDFVASQYCYSVEMQAAMGRSKAGQARVVPVILRPTELEGTPFMTLQALPRNAKPISTWSNEDIAWVEVVQGIKAIL
ncbi:MAG TPA: toll/interleukin-1 receptor domain-containing protein [Ktedonobacteraceae bacterium]|jgi:hypothetical protein